MEALLILPLLMLIMPFAIPVILIMGVSAYDTTSRPH